MSYLVFARKYRPQTFEQVIQQDHVTRTLSNAIAAGRVAHALLFSGPRGTGKTTVARILAKAMNCVDGPSATPCNRCRSCEEITAGHAADVFEIDGASNNSVDQIRELRDNLKYMPTYSRYKIYIIDEVHMLSLAAFNALLKTLEEPPQHVLFMFATTELHKIPVTILSRCQRHELRRIDVEAINEQLHNICQQEKIVADDESLALIAQEAGGSMRDALSLLDHVIACSEGPVTAEHIGDLLGIVDRRYLFEVSKAVFARDIQDVLTKIDTVWRQGYEIKRYFNDLLVHFHNLTMIKLGSQASSLVDLPAHEIAQMRTMVADLPESYLTQIFDLLLQAEPAIKLSNQPKLALEMVFLKLFQSPPVLPIDTLIDRLDKLRKNVDAIPSPPKVHEQHRQVEHPNNSTATYDSLDATQGIQENEQSNKQTQPLADDGLWVKVVERVGEERPSLAAFLNKCRLKTLAAGQLELEVADNGFTLKQVSKDTAFLEKICSDLAGHLMKLKIVANLDRVADKQKKKRKAGRLKQNALSHPMVLESLELFDGKVIDVKVS